MKNDKCNILITEDTKTRLKQIGFKDQTYDDIIGKLLDLNNSADPAFKKEVRLHDK